MEDTRIKDNTIHLIFRNEKLGVAVGNLFGKKTGLDLRESVVLSMSTLF